MGKHRIWGAFAAAVFLLSYCLPARAVSIGTFRETENGGGQENTQIGCGLENSVAYSGEWKITVKGSTVVAVGVGEALYRFVFHHPRSGKEYDSSLLTAAYPVSENTARFYGNWGKTVDDMTDYLYELFGDRVNFVSHDNIYQPSGGNVYVFYFELWNENKTNTIPVTIAYRFGQSYYMFAIGINEGDLSEVFSLAKQAGKDFRDFTVEPQTGFETMFFSGSYQQTVPDWNYEVVNPFQILADYFGE